MLRGKRWRCDGCLAESVEMALSPHFACRDPAALAVMPWREQVMNDVFGYFTSGCRMPHCRCSGKACGKVHRLGPPAIQAIATRRPIMPPGDSRQMRLTAQDGAWVGKAGRCRLS